MVTAHHRLVNVSLHRLRCRQNSPHSFVSCRQTTPRHLPLRQMHLRNQNLVDAVLTMS
jgi:hypothetical protein